MSDPVMISIDTNVFLYAQNPDCPEFLPARRFVLECADRGDVAVCEFVLVELYMLLRNPAVVANPLDAETAASICQAYRRNPAWTVVEGAPVMESVWQIAAKKGFARRRIMDARIAKTLQFHGVDEFATVNTKDFHDLGFKRVWNPLR